MTNNNKYTNENLTREELIEWAQTNPEFAKYITARNKRFTKECGYDSDPNKTLGYYYLRCPISGLHYVKFKKSYTDKLMISEGRLFELYPEYVRCAPEMIERSEMKQNTIDPRTGLSMRQTTSKKAHETMKAIDPATGKSINETKQEKRAIHLKETTDEFGFNLSQLQAAYRDINAINELRYKDNPSLVIDSEFRRYERCVEWALNKVRRLYKAQGVEFGRKGQERINPSLKQLDHKFSIAEGFKQKISPFCIAHIDNIEFLGIITNGVKNDSCSITIEELAIMCDMNISDMNEEYNQVMSIVCDDMIHSQGHSTIAVIKRLESPSDNLKLRISTINTISRK